MAKKNGVVFLDYSKDILRLSDAARKRALWQCGDEAVKIAVDLCPVGTPESTGIPGYVGGTLWQSIAHAEDDYNMYYGTNVEYAAFVELGTRRMKARPYLMPAVVGKGKIYKAIFKAEFERG